MRNFDGLICEKASKEGLKNLTHHCNATFILKEENQVFRNSTENKLEEFSEKIQYLNDLVVSSAKSVNKEMFGAVRKAVGQLQLKQETGQVNYGEVTDQFRDILKLRASKESVTALEFSKASKIDVELCMRWIDLLHRMVKSIMQIYTMKLKSEIDATELESEN